MENLVGEALLREYYHNKKVLVTGHTGFKGSWLLALLKNFGANIMGFAKPPKQEEDLYNLINGNDYCQSVIGDIRNRELLTKAVSDFQPDYIFHLAAQPLVRASYDIPCETFEVNAVGTANLLEAVKQLKGQCTVVIITTDKVYENKEWSYPYRETDALGGFDPYSASKACAEIVTNSFRSSFFNTATYNHHLKAIASARAGNVIGGGDWAKDRIIPDIVRALQENKPVLLRNPSAIRPWQHVLEPLVGYLMLAIKLQQDPSKFSGAWNFGPQIEDNLSVEKLAQVALNVWGTGSIEKPQQHNQPHEAGILKLDISKTQAMLPWKPVYNTLAAIEKTIKWYKNFSLVEQNVFELVQNDIRDFLNQLD